MAYPGVQIKIILDAECLPTYWSCALPLPLFGQCDTRSRFVLVTHVEPLRACYTHGDAPGSLKPYPAPQCDQHTRLRNRGSLAAPCQATALLFPLQVGYTYHGCMAGVSYGTWPVCGIVMVLWQARCVLFAVHVFYSVCQPDKGVCSSKVTALCERLGCVHWRRRSLKGRETGR